MAEINSVRERVLRSMIATVFLANGTPMLLAGDEFGNTQYGNNNAYCQDNSTSWLDWSQANSPQGRALTAFVARLGHLRRTDPSLRLDRYAHGDLEVAPGLTRIAWFDLDGRPMTQEAWDYAEGRVLGLRRAIRLGNGTVRTTLLLVNGSTEDVTFQLPATPKLSWRKLLDTAHPSQAATAWASPGVPLAAHSLVLLSASQEEQGERLKSPQ